MGRLLIDTAMERYVSSLGITAWLLVVAAAVFWYRPSHSNFPEYGGKSAQDLQNVVKKQWSQVRIASSPTFLATWSHFSCSL